MKTVDTSGKGPLSGVHILDLTSYFTGPFCTALLADYGADVIKLESLDGGDSMRLMGTSRGGLSAPFVTMNRGKRSIALDLKSPSSEATVRKLVRWADVVVQNFRPGVAEKLGLDHATCRDENPDVIHVSISGYGEEGPYASMPTFDSIVQGHTGICYAQGNDVEPAFVRQAIVDKVTAMYASHAVLAALFDRERGGGGQEIRLNMFDCSLAFHWADCMNEMTFLDGEVLRAPPMGSLYVTNRTRDGYVTVSPITDAQFWGYCRALGREDLVGDTRLDTLDKRVRARELAQELRAILSTLTTAEACERLAANDVPHGPVLPRESVLDDPQARFAAIHEGGEPGRRTRLVASPVRFGNYSLPVPSPAPFCGEHSEEILRALELSTHPS